MGRAMTPLTIEQAEEALDYLQRALNRKADLFSEGIKETRRSRAALRRRGLTLRRPDFAAQANDWLLAHLTPVGRQTMLAALRRGRAETRREEPLRTVRLPAATHEELSELAHKLRLSLADTIDRLLEAKALSNASS